MVKKIDGHMKNNHGPQHAYQGIVHDIKDLLEIIRRQVVEINILMFHLF